jgi:hypothetical protein
MACNWPGFNIYLIRRIGVAAFSGVVNFGRTLNWEGFRGCDAWFWGRVRKHDGYGHWVEGLGLR